jgi:quercetin dioxygenase-like cupin family protein
MISIVNRLTLAAALAGCFVLIALAQRRTPVTVTRLYTGPDGQTHAEDIDVKLVPRIPLDGYEQSETRPAASLQYVRAAPGYVSGWHTAPRRQYVITLSGRGEIELAGGKKIPMEPGRILLADDLTGKGHLTRTLGKEDRVSVVVQLAPTPR